MAPESEKARTAIRAFSSKSIHLLEWMLRWTDSNEFWGTCTPSGLDLFHTLFRNAWPMRPVAV